jgi:hypothetical protein
VDTVGFHPQKLEVDVDSGSTGAVLESQVMVVVEEGGGMQTKVETAVVMTVSSLLIISSSNPKI